MTDFKAYSNNISESRNNAVYSILVIGDVMLDKYWFSIPKNLASEAPVINIKVNKSEYRAGGAANVALNIKSLSDGNNIVSIYAPLGLDESGNILSQILLDRDIKCFWQYEQNQTITKHRVLTNKHQLLRVDFEQDYQNLELNSNLKKIIDSNDVIVISDYQKGSFSDQELPKIIAYAIGNNKKVLVDPKAKDFSKYKGATLITPNSKEFATAVGNIRNIDEQAQELIKKLDFEYILITQGADGMTLYSKHGDSYHACSYADEVYDVTGAGDTVIASMALSLAKSESIKKSVEYASYAAALVVSQIATVSVKHHEVDVFMRKAQNPKNNLVDRNKLLCVHTEAAFNKAISALTNNNETDRYSICYWDYQLNNILTKSNISSLLQQKNDSKLCVVVSTSNAFSEELKLNHSVDELAYMLSNLSAVDKVIYSKEIKLSPNIIKQVETENYQE